jgi:hypothetical protein
VGDANAMDNQDKEELRKYERFHFREDISIDSTRCTCMDISESGIYVAAQYFAAGDIVYVTLPFKGKNITIKGEVQNCENGVGVGIKFIYLNDNDRAIIKQLIHSINKTSESNPIKDFENSFQISLSMYEQDDILETLIILLNKKQIISDEELLSELKKKQEKTKDERKDYHAAG